MKTQITVDIETLGRGENAQIVQLAAIAFDKSGVQIGEFNKYVKWETNKYNFVVDPSTVAWWLKQSKEAINSVFGEKNRHSIKKVLIEFEDWCNLFDDYNLWQHSTFDAPKIQYAIRTVLKREPKIPYVAWKDIRTLTEVTGIHKTKVEGIAHNALDDCLNQKKYITKCLNK